MEPVRRSERLKDKVYDFRCSSSKRKPSSSRGSSAKKCRMNVGRNEAVVNLGKKRVCVGAFELMCAEKILKRNGRPSEKAWVNEQASRVPETENGVCPADPPSPYTAPRSCRVDEEAEVQEAVLDAEGRVDEHSLEYERLEGWLSNWELDDFNGLRKVAEFLGSLEMEELEQGDTVEPVVERNEKSDEGEDEDEEKLALWIVDLARGFQAEAEPHGLPEPVASFEPEISLLQAQDMCFPEAEPVSLLLQTPYVFSDETAVPLLALEPFEVPILQTSGYDSVPFGFSDCKAETEQEAPSQEAATPKEEADGAASSFHPLLMMPVADEAATVASRPKSILKPMLQPCSQACQCGQCASARLRADRASRFSQQQMHSFEQVSSMLLSSLRELLGIVQRSVASGEDSKQILRALKYGLVRERCARKMLHKMSRDCNRYCKIMLDSKPPGRRIVFADEVGKILDHVKVYHKH